jgi:hypothetical protein
MLGITWVRVPETSGVVAAVRTAGFGRGARTSFGFAPPDSDASPVGMTRAVPTAAFDPVPGFGGAMPAPVARAEPPESPGPVARAVRFGVGGRVPAPVARAPAGGAGEAPTFGI